MASKSRIPAVGITLVLCALASCARDGPTLEQAPPAEARHDTVACGEEEEMSEEEVAAGAATAAQ